MKLFRTRLWSINTVLRFFGLVLVVECPKDQTDDSPISFWIDWKKNYPRIDGGWP